MQEVGVLIQENFNFQLKTFVAQDYQNPNYSLAIIKSLIIIYD